MKCCFVTQILTFSCCLLGACVHSPNSPQELRFESVNVVHWRDLSDTVKNDIKQFDEKPRDMLRVSFSSEKDLMLFAKQNDNIGHDIFPCHERKNLEAEHEVARMNASLEVYYDGIPVNPETARNYETQFSKQQNNLLFMYQTYFDFIRKPYKGRLASGAPAPISYDLTRNSEDICFQIGGWRMAVGDSLTSNMVVIPKEAITNALAKIR